MRFVLLLTFTLVGATACVRAPEEGDSSTLSIDIPHSNKLGTFAAMPSGRKACYAVSVSGPGITPHPAVTCSPETGTVSGFVEAGQKLEATVPRGENRKIDIYLFLQQSGQNNPCPSMTAYFAPSQLSQIYKIASVTNVSMINDVTTVNITATFPGESNHIAQENAFPSSCTAGLVSVSPSLQVPADAKTVAGTGFKLLGRVGSSYTGPVLTGTGYRLKVK